MMNFSNYLIEKGFDENPLSNSFILRIDNPVKVKLIGKRTFAVSFPNRNCPKMDNLPLPRSTKHANILFRYLIKESSNIEKKNALENFMKYCYGNKE